RIWRLVSGRNDRVVARSKWVQSSKTLAPACDSLCCLRRARARRYKPRNRDLANAGKFRYRRSHVIDEKRALLQPFHALRLASPNVRQGMVSMDGGRAERRRCALSPLAGGDSSLVETLFQRPPSALDGGRCGAGHAGRAA